MAWLEQLQSLSEILDTRKPDPTWPAAIGLPEKLKEIAKTFSADLAGLEENASFVFSADIGVRAYTERVIDLFRRWHIEGNAPSLSALSVFAMQYFSIHEDDPLVRPVLMASLLGEVPNDLAYHNNMHYRKVLFQTISMIAVHNDIYGGTPQALDKDHIASLIAAACIHDLGHDGRANNTSGTQIRGRAEKRSFDLAKPYLEAAGFSDSELDDIFVMLLCTDVTPLDDEHSPACELKSAYRFHELGGEGKGIKPQLSRDTAILEKRADLALISMLLHEADVATSAGLDYETTCFETSLYRDEFAADIARPSHITEFISRVCRQQMLTDAGKKLYAENMDAIYKCAMEEVEKGDEPLPRPEDSSFMSGDESHDSDTLKKMN